MSSAASKMLNVLSLSLIDCFFASKQILNPKDHFLCLYLPDGTSQNITLSLNSKNGLSTGLLVTTGDYRKLSGSLLSLASVSHPHIPEDGFYYTVDIHLKLGRLLLYIHSYTLYIISLCSLHLSEMCFDLNENKRDLNLST